MNRLLTHTIEQPDSDTTTYILSCDRLDVLDKTINSFLKTADYVTKMVIVDDSARPGIFETLVEKYGKFCDVICFPKNRGQWWAMDFMVSYCDTEYIFYVEDDWEFLQSGYLNKSKEILKKYREIGTVDISWRTFEWQGIDSYEKTLVDDMFYWKKPWRISDYHLHWYGWIGSPNLKRRDDLIILGRVEKWHNEWNIDRKFLALGFKAVFLNGQYVVHLGDDCSRMAGKRPNDGTVPDDYYPVELTKNKIWQKNDYMFLDTHWRPPSDITIVSAMIDIGREDRNFEEHYLESVTKLLNSRHPIVMYSEEKYFDRLREIRGDRPLTLIKFDKKDLEKTAYFDHIQKIISSENWQNQSGWMKDSVISSPYYIPLTLKKHALMVNATRVNPNSSYYYWVDSGMFSSYKIQEEIDTFYFTKIPKDRFFITSWPYYTDSEIHGYNIDIMTTICEVKPNYVCRATLFGGTREQILQMSDLFYSEINNSIVHGTIGTEESIYTILSIKHPQLFNRVPMVTGNIYNYLNTLR